MARRRRNITGLEMTGPFFAKDPAKTFADNLEDFMDAVAKRAEAEVVARMRRGEATRDLVSMGLGRVSDRVVGRTSNLSGRRWRVTAKVSVVPKGLVRLEAIALMAAASEVESQTGAFRKVKGRIRKATREVDLLKDIR